MVIGPHGLFLIKKNSAVDLFSTIGLLYIMFIAGLELDLGEFRKHRNKSLVFGLLTFLIPISLGVPACLYLLGYGFSTSLLTASMFATHTLIAYPIVNRLGISKMQAVAIAVGGTILTDTAVLFLLAIVSGWKESGLTSDFWVGLVLSVSIFILVVFLVVPRISSWFFKRLEDEKYAHFIYVLSVVFFCAFLAELSGLEPIIGAFAAGLMLNRFIPHTSALMNRIEFVGNALFIPFFLISVGMLIDVQVLTNGYHAILVAVTLTTVALTSKWLAAHLTGFLFKYSRPERNIIFGLSSAHAAATLAVILIGYQIGLIDDNILNGTIVLILITCVVASFITEKAGKQLLLQSDTQPEHVSETQRILVPIANPETMERLIDFSIAMKRDKDHSPIMAVSVVKDDEQAQHKLIQSKKLLEKVTIHAASTDQYVQITSTIDRNVSNGIKRVVKENFITDIVLGWSEQKSLADLIFGRTFDSLVKQTTQTIFITRFLTSINVQKRVVVMIPFFAERESGFHMWLQSLLNIAFHFRMNMLICAPADTQKNVNDFVILNKHTVNIAYDQTSAFGDSKALRLSLTTDDMLVLICSREGGVSYDPVMTALPQRLSKKFASNNLVFIYPATTMTTSIPNYEQEVTGGMIEKSLLWIDRAKRIFKK
jgi:Kef-type K+ transport system membrane component KefB